MAGHQNGSCAHSFQATDAGFDDSLLAGLYLLRQAYVYAQDTGADLWDFALEISALYDAGLTINDLRWLVAKGLVKHGLETSAQGNRHRSFELRDGFRFESTSCLVLTPGGVEYAARALMDATWFPVLPPAAAGTPTSNEVSVARSNDVAPRGERDEAADQLKPRWDPTRRELYVARAIVKRFRVPAPNQETILGVFEEEGWPDQIDDPLPISDDIDPRTRLHDAINRLNGCQAHPLLRFHGNGSGTGVTWELRKLATPRRAGSDTAERISW